MRPHGKRIERFPDQEEVSQSIDRYQERQEAERVRDVMQQILLGSQ